MVIVVTENTLNNYFIQVETIFPPLNFVKSLLFEENSFLTSY